MKVTYNWLKEFVQIRMPAGKLAQRLTMAGLEVTSLEAKGGDFVFEIEVTSNRPDWLSIIGIAREVAAITGKKLKLDPRSSMLAARKNKRVSSLEQRASKLEIKVENKRDCPLYIAKIIKGVRVRPSPAWMQKRLKLIGLRPVNNIVDITNYLLMETGQPMHAFDLGKIKDNTIFIRRANNSEKIITLDSQQHNLASDILVIADKEKPIAVAGIMGSRESEVSNATRDILLEAAVFDPVITRRACRWLGVSSESSYRFERGVDIYTTDFAAQRATQLILKLAAGRLTFSKSTPLPQQKDKNILLEKSQVNGVLGVKYSSTEIKHALTLLGFSVKQNVNNFKIKVPAFRADVNQAIDLIEEIARIQGYENIPVKLPKIIPQERRAPALTWEKIKLIKDILISQGICEALTYSLINRELAAELGYADNQLTFIANPLTRQQEILRPSLIFGLLSCIAENLNQKQKDIRIFEISKGFLASRESLFLGLAALSNNEFNLLHLKGALELLLKRLGISEFEFVSAKSAHLFFQKGNSLSLVLNGRTCAELGIIKPSIQNKFDIKDSLIAAEVDLEIIFSEAAKVSRRYIPLPRFPEVVRDLSIIVQEGISLGNIIKKIKTSGIAHLIEVSFKKDIYRGRQIPTGNIGVTLSCVYRAPDHTLTSEEVGISHQQILDILTREFSARLR